MFIYEKRWTEEQQEEGQEAVEVERRGVFYAEGNAPSEDDVEVLFGGPDTAADERKTFDELKEEELKFVYNRDKAMWVGLSERQLPLEDDIQLIGFAGDAPVIGAPPADEEEEEAEPELIAEP